MHDRDARATSPENSEAHGGPDSSKILRFQSHSFLFFSHT